MSVYPESEVIDYPKLGFRDFIGGESPAVRLYYAGAWMGHQALIAPTVHEAEPNQPVAIPANQISKLGGIRMSYASYLEMPRS